MTQEIDYTKKTIIDIARSAGEIALTYFKSPNLKSTAKSEIDFLTEADSKVDEFIRKSIKEHFPEATLLTEETSTGDFSFVKNLENVWVVDPIDGTTNFSRKDNHFAISIAKVDNGVPQIGVVYLPVENKLYFAANADDHAYLNNEIISVSDTSDLKIASIGYDWSWDLEKRKKTMNILQKFYLEVRQSRSLGSAASDLCLVADGTLDAYINAGLKPWDMAAGMLIVQKAGGQVKSLVKGALTVFEPDIIATNKNLSTKLQELIS